MNAGARGELLDICEPNFSGSLRIVNAETGEIPFESPSDPTTNKAG